jgi:predicted SAM-dependent methyltransferase
VRANPACCSTRLRPARAARLVNIDYDPVDEESLYFDAIDGLPIESEAARHIHCEHFLEHLEYRDALHFLRECHRVLDRCGTMRIIVPDAERYLRAYCAGDDAFFERLVDLGGHAEPLRPKIRVCNQMFRMFGDHRFAWDFEALETAALECGFSQVARSSINEGELAIDGQDWRRPFEPTSTNSA